MKALFDSFIGFETTHWQGQLALALTQLPSIIVAMTPYPRVDGFLKKLLQLLNIASLLVHKDSPGTFKFPFTQSQPPAVIGQVVPVLPKGFATIKLLFTVAAVTAVISWMGGCAATWANPVFYAGPAVAPIEEVSLKNPIPAAAAGFQETVGLGQFTFAAHTWDALDISVLELGGILLPGSGPAGALQVGGELGTLNGIIGVGFLATPYAANGGGFLQGGSPGLTIAGMLNVQALVTYFSSPTATWQAADLARLPRGGL